MFPTTKTRCEIGAIYRLLARAKANVAFLRRHIQDKTYNPHQPRVPAGNSNGGQWTSGGAGDRDTEGGLVLAQLDIGVLVAEIPRAIGRLCVYEFSYGTVAVPGATNFRCAERQFSSAVTHGQLLNDNRRKFRRLL